VFLLDSRFPSVWSSLLNVNSTALLTFVKALLVILAKKSQDVSGGHFAEGCSRPERGGLAAGGVQGCTHLFSPSCRKYTSSTSGAFDMPGYAASRTPPRQDWSSPIDDTTRTSWLSWFPIPAKRGV